MSIYDRLLVFGLSLVKMDLKEDELSRIVSDAHCCLYM